MNWAKKIQDDWWKSQQINGETMEQTKKRVWASVGEYSDNMAKYHRLCFKLLSELDAICHAYGIKYWLMGGTLIGAIRHQAFIPWDSDMDVGMTRADWRYFVSAIKNNGRYMIETKFKGGRYLYCLHYDVGIPSNPKLDIFVFDYYEGTYEEAMHKNAQIRKEFKEQFVGDMAGKGIVDAIQEFADSYNLTKGRWLCWGMENIESHATDPRWVKRVDDILPTTKLALYGRFFSVPANFIKFVKEEHSDYMDFPPVTICKREGKLMEDYNRHIKANIITE